MPDKKHLLIAEDEMHTVLSLKILLRRAGYATTFVGDGAKALALLSGSSPETGANGFDMLLTDIQMPKMTGLELIKTMKAKSIKTPVLVLTGFGDKETLIELLREGCEDYIDKPFTEKDLMDRVKRTLERSEALTQERNKADDRLAEAKRKLEVYRTAFSSSCESMERAISSYRQIMGEAVSSSKVKVSVKMASKDRLGGDYCALHDFPWGSDLIVADVAGHDMGASYHTVLLKSFFDMNCIRGDSGESFFDHLNTELLGNGSVPRMVTALFGRVDLNAMSMDVVSAAHPHILQIKAGGSGLSVVRPISGKPGFPLGVFNKINPAGRRLEISAGDRIFIYTDGVPNARTFDPGSNAWSKLGEDGLLDLIQRNLAESIESTVARSWYEIMKFSGEKISDDMLLMGIEIPPPCGKEGG